MGISMLHRLVTYLLVVSVAFQILLHFAIPLMPHYLTDPAWYYMFKAYLFDGIWIQEDIYPSFHRPVLYYCSLGYPLLLYFTGAISLVSGLPFACILLQVQFVLYLITARLVWVISKKLLGSTQASLVCLAYLWFLPYFNYAHLVMSETWFVFCLVTLFYFCSRALEAYNRMFLCLSFLMASYLFLVRPVGGVLMIVMLVILFWHSAYRSRRLHVAAASLLFFVFPLFQSAFNKIEYSTWAMREGLGWNLWNRVVFEDGYNPEKSAATLRLRQQLGDSSFHVAPGHWWNIASDLSYRGMQPGPILAYCLEVDIDGILQSPLPYLGTTFKRGLWVLPTEPQETICIFKTAGEYSQFLRDYHSGHHAPLNAVLDAQKIGGNSFAQSGLSAYYSWHFYFHEFFGSLFHTILYLFIPFALVLWLVQYKRSKSPPAIIIILIASVLTMSLASCAFEVLHARYFIPCMLAEFIVAAWSIKTLMHEIKYSLKRRI